MEISAGKTLRLLAACYNNTVVLYQGAYSGPQRFSKPVYYIAGLIILWGGNWLLLCLQQIVAPHCLGGQKQQAHTTGGHGDIRLALNSIVGPPWPPMAPQTPCYVHISQNDVFWIKQIVGTQHSGPPWPPMAPQVPCAMSMLSHFLNGFFNRTL